MTTWSEYKKKHPLRGEAKRAYDAARREMGVGYLILQARAAAGLSQAQLAKKIGTSQSMIARWESGAQVPSVSSLLRIAGATGFDLALAFQKHGSKEREFHIVRSGEPLPPGRPANRPRRVPAAKRRAV